MQQTLLWDYPLDLPISTMELGHRGACRQLTVFYALAMHSCGLPVTVDRAVWANRSLGHSWNVLVLNNNRIFPFDALTRDSMVFAYKPAKIFRKKFGLDKDKKSAFYEPDEADVTHEYVKTYDISVPVKKAVAGQNNSVVICVFDNENWKPVFDGKLRKGQMVFKNMASNTAYIGAYDNNGYVIPATDPFILREDGSIYLLRADTLQPENLCLERKYPRFKRIEDHAWGVRRSNAEGSDNANFGNATKFFSVNDIPFSVHYFKVNTNKKFRFFRLNSAWHRSANYAELEFYGKFDLNGNEERLTGKIIGFPEITADNSHPYTHSMDGNLETWFEKARGVPGWAGIDLGKGKAAYLTRIKFCPRSDTNFILEGDEYELMYWSDSRWKSAGRKRAEQYNFINFENVPSKALYLLHNHTRGIEERIFTYENDKQIFW